MHIFGSAARVPGCAKKVSRTFLLSSPNVDEDKYKYKGSIATQLRGGGIFINHFITNFPQNVPVKKL